MPRGCGFVGVKENRMSQKNEGRGSNKDAESDAAEARGRRCLLVQVAGHVAAGIIVAPSATTANAAAVAEVAVDIAEEILKKAGL